MPSDQNMEGRHENASRSPLLVCITSIQTAARRGEEKTYTENVSLHGARVISQRPWQPGEEAQVTPLKYGTPVRGRVVYCKRTRWIAYFVGLKLPHHPVYWSSFTYPAVW